MAPLLCVCMAAALLIICFLPLVTRLTVSDGRSQSIRLCLPIRPQETFYLRYTHSVNLSDVTDGFEWTGETLMVRSTLFTAYGVGMPVLADGIGKEFTHTPDGFLLTGIDRPEKNILILMQEVPNYRLLHRGGEIRLLEYFGSGTLVLIEPRRVSILTALLARG